MRWGVRAGLIVTFVALSGCGGADAADHLYDGLRRARGALSSAETVCDGERGRYALCIVRLESNTGLLATGRMLVPLDVSGRVPAVLLNAGLWIGSGVIEALPAEFGDIAVLAMDYPAGIPRDLEPAEILANAGKLRSAGREIAARFSLAGEFLARDERIDPERLAIIGGSFAVPFTGLAAAMDDRFRNVALIYGGGELPALVAANYRLLPGPLNAIAARVVARPFSELDPSRHVHLIAPRPLLMINGREDDRMPERSVRRLFEAARQPKELVWMGGGHLHSRDDDLITALVDTAFSRLPVLRDAVRRVR